MGFLGSIGKPFNRGKTSTSAPEPIALEQTYMDWDD